MEYIKMAKDFNFLVYNTPDKDIKVNAVIKDDTIWLTQKSMAELFGVQTPAISKHLKNIFEEGELENGKWIPGRTLNGDEKMSVRLGDMAQCYMVELYKY